MLRPRHRPRADTVAAAGGGASEARSEELLHAVAANLRPWTSARSIAPNCEGRSVEVLSVGPVPGLQEAQTSRHEQYLLC
jgi:hypothetical protein